MIQFPNYGVSSSGRTADSESASRGSNPCTPARKRSIGPSARRANHLTKYKNYQKIIMIHYCKERFGNYFEDFATGNTYKHWSGRTITEADDTNFCMLTMNHHPLHIDSLLRLKHNSSKE